MKKLAVQEIIIPRDEGTVSKPSVSPEDKITDAIEVMLKNNLKRIAVAEGDKLLGMVSLEDAFKKIGLERKLKSKGTRSIVIHGRKIIVEEKGT